MASRYENGVFVRDADNRKDKIAVAEKALADAKNAENESTENQAETKVETKPETQVEAETKAKTAETKKA